MALSMEFRAPSLSWKFDLDTFPADFGFVAEAIKLQRSAEANVATRQLAHRFVKEALGRRLLKLGCTIEQLGRVERFISDSATGIVGLIDNNLSIISPDSVDIARIFDNVESTFPEKLSNSLMENGLSLEVFRDILEDDIKYIIESQGIFDILSARLRDILRNLITERLCETGMPKERAIRLAGDTVRDFQVSAGDKAAVPISARAADLAALLVKSFERVRRAEAKQVRGEEDHSESFPEIPSLRWKNKKDRLPGETPIAFLQRVWRDWLGAGLLYQDSLTRMGEAKLGRAIRTYCSKEGLKAADYLPPPRHARTDRALANAQSGTLEEQVLRQRVQRRMARKRRGPT
jgi:hypothetical protein